MVRVMVLFLSIGLLAVSIAGAAGTKSDTAVLVIDVQPCFVEGGALAVAGANATYVSHVQRSTKWLHRKGYLVLGSRDYHPANHISFYTNHPEINPAPKPST